MKQVFVFIISTLAALSAMSQNSDGQLDLRANPQFELSEEADIATLDSLFLAYNDVVNRGLWEQQPSFGLTAKSPGQMSILHIGDSHIQADMATAVARDILAEHLGSRGRGLILPFRAAGTNEPRDYCFTTDVPGTGHRMYMKNRPEGSMPATGVSIAPLDTAYAVSISCREPFDKISVFFDGNCPVVSTIVLDSTTIQPSADSLNYLPGEIEILLADEQNSVCLGLTQAVPGQTRLLGAELSIGNEGLKYHAIGHNGAQFGDYATLPGLEETISRLHPDLIIISLGTNDAFSPRYNSDALAENIRDLVQRIKQADASCQILLTTPQEAYRRRKTGKRRSIKEIHPNIARAQNVIRQTAIELSLPLYDWGAISHSPALWQKQRLLSTDGIHLTQQGYTLMGILLGHFLLRNISSK